MDIARRKNLSLIIKRTNSADLAMQSFETIDKVQQITSVPVAVPVLIGISFLLGCRSSSSKNSVENPAQAEDCEPRRDGALFAACVFFLGLNPAADTKR